MVQGHDYVKMATSVIDYIFRDLAISYLKRSDLGQVKPEDLITTGTKGEMDGGEAKQRFGGKQSVGFKPTSPSPSANTASGGAAPGGQKSIGFSGPGSSGQSPAGDNGKGTVKALAGGTPGHSPDGAVSVQTAPMIQVLDQPRPEQSEVVKIAQARIKGYEGDPCPTCGSFTLVRSGTCMKCNTCGSTTGCS
jgi:ribonucleoside-diphosphate reductase alpha chain